MSLQSILCKRVLKTFLKKSIAKVLQNDTILIVESDYIYIKHERSDLF